MERCNHIVPLVIPDKYEVGIQITEKDVENWIRKINRESQCNTPVYSHWNSKLWSESYDEIVEYLLNRLNKTSLETEYYMCLLYLEKHLPAKLRFLPFKESIQYKRAIGEEIDSKKLKEKTHSLVSTVKLVKYME